MEGMVGLVAGTAWAAGVNLYAVVALLGIYGRVGAGDVPEVFTRTDVIAVALALFAVEFVVDKVPYLDDLWDVVHTAVRPLGAAALGAILAGDTLPDLAAAVGTGGVAFVSHAVKATTRLAVNTSPEPASNVAVSVVEDVAVAGTIAVAIINPWIAAGIALVLLIAASAIAVVLLRTARKVVRMRGRFREQSASVDP
jgi:hypothetical protein